MRNLATDSLWMASKIVKGLFISAFAGVAFVALSPLHADIDEDSSRNSSRGGGSSKHSGLFIGAELGVSAQLGKETVVGRTTAGNNTTTTTTTTNADQFPLGAVGLKFGYTHFFNK